METNKETLWIKVKGKTNINIAVMYGLQENAKREDAERQSQDLTTDIRSHRDDQTIITGDLNAKLEINRANCNQKLAEMASYSRN